MKRLLSWAAVAALALSAACAEHGQTPLSPAGDAPDGPEAAAAAGAAAQTGITLEALVPQALQKLATDKGQAIANSWKSQVDALTAKIQADLAAGNQAAAAADREQLRKIEVALVLTAFGPAIVPAVQDAVAKSLAELGARADSLAKAGKDVTQAKALLYQAAALLDKSKAQPVNEKFPALDYATQAGAVLQSARALLGGGETGGGGQNPPPAPPPPPPPSGGLWSTIETPRPWDYVPTPVSQSACAGAGTNYDVGPGQAYATLASVPWLKLLPCDNVRIHWQSSPYREIVLLTNRGAANRYIRITGIPGPGGALPVLDGAGATADAAIPWLNPVLEGYGLIAVSPPKGATYGYKPGYIEISNLEIRGASNQNTFVNHAGQTTPWDGFASGIYIERAENVAIRNCHVHDNGNGIFQNSKFDEAAQSRYLLVEGNYVHDNGRVGDAHDHNAYTEGVGTVYQFNYFGQPAVGSYGDNIKERSAGITFRYNYVEGGVDLIALRDPQSNAPYERIQKDAWGSLLVNSAYVYGNVLVMKERASWKTGWGNTLVGFGDGDASYGDVRGGTLYFYGNTVVSFHDYNPYADNPLFAVINSLPQPVVQARNNVFLALTATAGAKAQPFEVFYHYGNAAFAANWISTGWKNNGGHASGQVMTPGQPWNGTGIGTVLTNAQNDPGLVNAAGGDYHLKAGSPLIDAGVALDPEVVKTGNVPVMEWVAQTQSRLRARNGALDLGAFEF